MSNSTSAIQPYLAAGLPNMDYIMRADQEVASSPDALSLQQVRHIRLKFWKTLGKTGRNPVESALGRFSGKARLAMDDFIVIDMYEFFRRFIDRVSYKGAKNPFKLGLSSHEAMIRQLVLMSLVGSGKHNVNDIVWKPMIRPHEIVGGPVQPWLYRVLPENQMDIATRSNRGAFIGLFDKRQFLPVRFFRPQEDSGCAKYGSTSS